MSRRPPLLGKITLAYIGRRLASSCLRSDRRAVPLQVGDGQRLLQAIRERSASREAAGFTIEVAVTGFAW